MDMSEIEIEELIEILKAQQTRGATKVMLHGSATLITNEGNTVIMRTVEQH